MKNKSLILLEDDLENSIKPWVTIKIYSIRQKETLSEYIKRFINLTALRLKKDVLSIHEYYSESLNVSYRGEVFARYETNRLFS